MPDQIKTLTQVLGELPDNTTRLIKPPMSREIALMAMGLFLNRDPNVDDDVSNTNGAGFADRGSWALNYTAKTVWRCFSGTTHAADWRMIGPKTAIGDVFGPGFLDILISVRVSQLSGPGTIDPALLPPSTAAPFKLIGPYDGTVPLVPTTLFGATCPNGIQGTLNILNTGANDLGFQLTFTNADTVNWVSNDVTVLVAQCQVFDLGAETSAAPLGISSPAVAMQLDMFDSFGPSAFHVWLDINSDAVVTPLP